jgi:hypothetical protein
VPGLRREDGRARPGPWWGVCAWWRASTPTTPLHALVGELSARSEDFASTWADHRVKARTVAAYETRHPLVGALTVTRQTLSRGPDQHIVVATTEPDSPARTTPALLAQAVAQADPARPGVRADAG